MTRQQSGIDRTVDRSGSRNLTDDSPANRPFPSSGLDRRRFVLAGVATMASLAGCIGDDDADDSDDDDGADDVTDTADDTADDPDDGTDDEPEESIEFGDEIQTLPAERPEYAKWLADADEGLVMRADYSVLQQIEAYDTLGGEGDTEQDFDGDFGDEFPHIDSIAEGFPTFAAWGPLFIFAFMGFAYPIVEDIEMLDDDDVETPIFTADSIMLVGEAMVLEGTAHVDAIDAREDVELLETHGTYDIYGVTPALDFGFGDEFEEDDADDEFDPDEAEPFAIGDGELVFPFVDDDVG